MLPLIVCSMLLVLNKFYIMIIGDNNNNKMIKITDLSSTDAVALYEFQVDKASSEQNQNGHSISHDWSSRTTCEVMSHVHTHGPTVLAGCNSKNQA